MRRRRSMIIVSLMFVLIVVLSGCKKKNVGPSEDNPVVEEETEEQEHYVFGYSCADMDNPYYATLRKVISEVVKEEGHELYVKNPENDAEVQSEQIEWMIEKGVDAIILAPVDWEAITPTLEKLHEADVVIINVDTKVREMDLVDSYVGSDNYTAGVLCGKDVMERFPSGGKILILENVGTNSVNDRIRGFEETIATHGFEVVGRTNAESDVDLSAIEVKKLLTAHPDAQIIMCGNDRMALGALQAVEALHMEKDVIIYGVDGSPEVKQKIATGGSPIVATVGQSLIDMGKNAVKVGLQILNHEKYEEEIYEETFLIDSDNINTYGSDGWN